MNIKFRPQWMLAFPIVMLLLGFIAIGCNDQPPNPTYHAEGLGTRFEVVDEYEYPDIFNRIVGATIRDTETGAEYLQVVVSKAEGIGVAIIKLEDKDPPAAVIIPNESKEATSPPR